MSISRSQRPLRQERHPKRETQTLYHQCALAVKQYSSGPFQKVGYFKMLQRTTDSRTVIRMDILHYVSPPRPFPFRVSQANDLPVDVLAGAKAEAVAKRARSARIRCIMVAVYVVECNEQRRQESNSHRRRL